MTALLRDNSITTFMQFEIFAFAVHMTLDNALDH